MMRRILPIILLLALSMVFVGCAEQKESLSTNPNEKDIDEFFYLTEESNENLICVQIPVVTTIRAKAVNTCIKEQVYLELQRWLLEEYNLEESATTIPDISERIDSSEYSKQYLHISCRRSFESESLISLVFTGTHNVTSAAHPNEVFFTINVDIPSAKRVGIADIYIVDDVLYTAFLQHASSDRISHEELMAYNVFEKNTFLEGLTQEPQKEVYSYFTPTHVGISYPVAHGLGDHIEAEISYENMKTIE